MNIKRSLKKVKNVLFQKRVSTQVQKKDTVVGNFFEESLIFCNFCAAIFRQNGPRHSEFLACPVCGAIARERVVYQCILDELQHQKGEPALFFRGTQSLKRLRLLEFSPRFNPLRRQIYQETLGEYLASDFDLSAHRADIRLDLTCLDNIVPYSGHFDIVICAHVLEHIPNYQFALENLYKLLAPGGLLVLQVPLLERQYVEVVGDEFHGDNTRVYHRFGFDLQFELNKIFSSTKSVVGLLDFSITSPEIDPEKYGWLKAQQNEIVILGNAKMQYFGLGSPDLCDAFLAYRDA